MRIGFLGAGQVALEHARAFSSLGHAVAAVCASSPSSERLARFLSEFPSARATGLEAMLSDQSLDALVACLPWDETPRRLDALLSHSKPVLIEKPLALDRATLRAALAAAPAEAVTNKRVGYNRRFYEPVARLRDRLAEGGLKSVEICVSEDCESQSRRHGEAILPRLPAFSSHALDLASHLFGPLRIERVFSHRGRGAADRYPSLSALLLTRAGVPVWLSMNGDDPSPAGFRARFEDGTAWHLAPLETLTAYRGHEVLPPEPGHRVRRYLPKAVERVDCDGTLKPGFVAQARAFAAGAPGPTPAESLELLELIEALQAARA